MCSTLEPAVETSPEPDILGREVQSENLRLGRVVVERVDKLIRRVGEETPEREGLLVQLQLRSLPLTVSCKYSSVRQGRSYISSALTYEGSKLTTVNMIVYCYQVLGIELKCLQVIINQSTTGVFWRCS